MEAFKHSNVACRHYFWCRFRIKARFPRLWLFTFSRDKVWIQPVLNHEFWGQTLTWNLNWWKLIQSKTKFKNKFGYPSKILIHSVHPFHSQICVCEISRYSLPMVFWDSNFEFILVENPIYPEYLGSVELTGAPFIFWEVEIKDS